MGRGGTRGREERRGAVGWNETCIVSGMYPQTHGEPDREQKKLG